MGDPGSTSVSLLENITAFPAATDQVKFKDE
jgi:hypothetical protein